MGFPMAVEGLARKLLDDLLYRHGFPPRAEAERIPNGLAARGLGQSSILAQDVAAAYLDVIAAVLDDFVLQLTKNPAAFGLITIADVTHIVLDAHGELFNAVRDLVRDEVPGAGYGALAAASVDARRTTVGEHLQRMIELRVLEAEPAKPARELDQKFRILWSARQAEQDFAAYVEAARPLGNSVVLVYLDLDNFKPLNTRFTNAKVDETVLPTAQRLLAKLVQGRGEAYLHGGDEMLVIVSNLDDDEARAFAEKLRRSFEVEKFEIDGEAINLTASIGVAAWPLNGSTYQAVLEAANRAQVDAKARRNTVVVAGEPRSVSDGDGRHGTT